MTAISYFVMAIAASAATTDIKEKRISNKLVFPVMLIAFSWHAIQNGISGITFSFLGWIVGLLVFMLPFIFGAMGAGDVKLMAAIGSLMGWRFILVTAVYTAMAGFFIAIAIIIKQRNCLSKPISYLPHRIAKVMAKALLSKNEDSGSVSKSETYSNNEKSTKTKTMIPYGLCIAIGVYIVLVCRDMNAVPLMNFLT